MFVGDVRNRKLTVEELALIATGAVLSDYDTAAGGVDQADFTHCPLDTHRFVIACSGVSDNAAAVMVLALVTATDVVEDLSTFNTGQGGSVSLRKALILKPGEQIVAYDYAATGGIVYGSCQYVDVNL